MSWCGYKKERKLEVERLVVRDGTEDGGFILFRTDDGEPHVEFGNCDGETVILDFDELVRVGRDSRRLVGLQESVDRLGGLVTDLIEALDEGDEDDEQEENPPPPDPLVRVNVETEALADDISEEIFAAVNEAAAATLAKFGIAAKLSVEGVDRA